MRDKSSMEDEMQLATLELERERQAKLDAEDRARSSRRTDIAVAGTRTPAQAGSWSTRSAGGRTPRHRPFGL